MNKSKLEREIVYMTDKELKILKDNLWHVADWYTVMIGGHQSYLFVERGTAVSGNNIGRWFVERR